MRYQIQIYTQKAQQISFFKKRANKPGTWETRNSFDYLVKAIKNMHTGGVSALVPPELMETHGISLLRTILSLANPVTSEQGLLLQAERCFLLESCKLAYPEFFFFFSQEKLNRAAKVKFIIEILKKFHRHVEKALYFLYNTETITLILLFWKRRPAFLQ